MEIHVSEWQNASIQKGLTEVKEKLIEHSQSTRELPKDIRTFSFCKFAGTYFQVWQYRNCSSSSHAFCGNTG